MRLRRHWISNGVFRLRTQWRRPQFLYFVLLEIDARTQHPLPVQSLLSRLFGLSARGLISTQHRLSSIHRLYSTGRRAQSRLVRSHHRFQNNGAGRCWQECGPWGFDSQCVLGGLSPDKRLCLALGRLLCLMAGKDHLHINGYKLPLCEETGKQVCVVQKEVPHMAKRRANGEGNIRKRKDGRWEGRYTAGHAPDTGKAIYKNVLGRTQAEVKEKLKKAIGEGVILDSSKAGRTP